MKHPYARPGHMGLFCGQCGDALRVSGEPERHRPEIWHCTKCKTSWRVPVEILTSAARVTRGDN